VPRSIKNSVAGNEFGLVTYRAEKPSALTSYVFDFIFDLLGLPSRETTEPQCAIYYGEPNRAPENALVIPQRSSDLIWEGSPEPSRQPGTLSSPVFPFDVVNSIRRFLTDDVNRDAGQADCDEHGRLLFDGSFQGRSGIGESPTVNEYARVLGCWLTEHLGITAVPAWPNGRRCAIGLSHDVDRVARRSKTLFWPPYAFNLSKYANLMVARQRLWHVRQLFRFPLLDDIALFKQVIRLETDHGCSSTFFFASRNRFGRHASLLDVQYDIRNRRLRGLLADLRKRGFGIGLHSSYRAFEAPGRFAEERRVLQEISGADVIGLRHHFWHLGADISATLAAHEAAGFEYDSSIAFNEHLGFRRSVAWPYYPWNEGLDRPLATMQIPVFCMDGNLFYTSSSVDDAVEKIATIIGRIKAVGGVGAIDWHSDTANAATPGYREWGEAYERLVRMLANDSEVWTTSLETILDWVKARRLRLSKGASSSPDAPTVQ
jgi:hypothetical protein